MSYTCTKNLRCFLLGILLIGFVLSGSKVKAQNQDTVIFTSLGNYSFNWPYSGYTPLIDRLSRPYVYLACKELGLVTFDVSNPAFPVPADTLTPGELGNLKATGVAQDSTYLFVSLGDFQGAGETAGLAIFDISNPLQPLELDRWDSVAFNKGTSSVVFEGNYAYLSAMQFGVIILDITDKEHILFASQALPDSTFGNHNHVYHARGLFIRDDTLLVAHDNGGLRAFDVLDKFNPLEIGMYLHQGIDTTASAFYNHVYRVGNTAWCSVDFCGFEAVDISIPNAMINQGWFNPWSCTNQPPPFGSWNGSDGHTNEIAFDANTHTLFFSGGDSQVMALRASDPQQPLVVGSYGPPDDNLGTWGIDLFGNLIALANIRTPGFPFVSNQGGLQLLSWQYIVHTTEQQSEPEWMVFPNPAENIITIRFTDNVELVWILVLDLTGRECYKAESIKGQTFQINKEHLQPGSYWVHVLDKRGSHRVRQVQFLNN